MAGIHPTAVIDPHARIATDVGIGPYCVIGPHVVIGEGCRLAANVSVTGHTTIGARTRIAPFASLGTPPQSLKYRGGPTQLIVGSDCDIREHVTMNTGTEDGHGVTRVGDRCFLMVGTHIGHDCDVGDDVIMANNSMLGGHVSLGANVVLRGQSVIHQFVRIGEGGMLSGFSGLGSDLIPFGIAIGHRGALDGINVVGMKRRGYSRADIHRVRQAYQRLFLDDGNFRDRVALAEQEFAGDPVVGKIFDFIRAGGGKRPILTVVLKGSSNVEQAGAAAST